jgi:hypothetical protein
MNEWKKEKKKVKTEVKTEVKRHVPSSSITRILCTTDIQSVFKIRAHLYLISLEKIVTTYVPDWVKATQYFHLKNNTTFTVTQIKCSSILTMCNI